MLDKLIFFYKFILRLFTAIYSCLKNRNKAVILVSSADLSTVIEGEKKSPFAFALQQKLVQDTTLKPLILLRSDNGGSNYSYDFSIHSLLSLASKLRSVNFAWRIILKLLAPKIIFAIDWDITLNKSCKSAKTPIYYLQHGVINDQHMYFGYEALKSIKDQHLPTGFLCWDETSTLNFRETIKAFNVGNLWNMYCLENISLFKNNNYELPTTYKSNKETILITLTWGNPQYKNIPEEFVQVIKKTYKKYNWFIRLHPVIFQSEELKNQFEQFMCHNFNEEQISVLEWKAISEFPLPILLLNTSCHLTIESSVVIEAAQFGVSSLILNSNIIKQGPKNKGVDIIYGGPAYYKAEREMGYATIYCINLNIEEWIDTTISKPKKALINSDLHNSEWHLFCKKLKEYS